MTSISDNDNDNNGNNGSKYLSKQRTGGPRIHFFFFKSEATAANLMVKHQTLFPLNEVLTIIAANQNVSEVSEQCH